MARMPMAGGAKATKVSLVEWEARSTLWNKYISAHKAVKETSQPCQEEG